VWDQKPPAIFVTYLVCVTAFGWSPSAIAWLDILVSAITTALLFAVARRLGGTTLGMTAATVYAPLTIPSWLYRHGGFLERSVAETFIAACVAVAAACGAGLRSGGAWGWRALGLGLAAGAAIAYKPNAVLYLPVLLVWIAVYRAPGVRLTPVVLAAALGCAILPAISIGWLWSHGVLAQARVALIDFNRFYVAEDFSPAQFSVSFAKEIWRRCKTDPLWAAGGIGALVALWDLARFRRLDPLPALALAWGAAAAMVIVLNGVRLFNTYFIQALAPLALLAAWVVAGVGTRRGVGRLGAAAAILVMATLLARKNYPVKVFDAVRADIREWRGAGDQASYLDRFGEYGAGGGYSARANVELAAYVRARTVPTDVVYQFGINSAGLYFAADRLMAQRFLRVNEFVPTTFPAPGFNLAAVARELDARRPVYLVFEHLPGRTVMADAVNRLPQAPELVSLWRAYQPETQIEDYAVYRRRD
jgi:hypothetical protein